MNINFVCWGNICRSPMAEFVMKKLVDDAGLSDKIAVESSGCHADVGTPISDGTCQQLKLHDIPFKYRTSRQLTRADYSRCDYIVGMDFGNIRDIKKIVGGDPNDKVFLMMDFVGEHRDVADPYMTDKYDVTYRDVLRGCTALLDRIRSLAQ